MKAKDHDSKSRRSVFVTDSKLRYQGLSVMSAMKIQRAILRGARGQAASCAVVGESDKINPIAGQLYCSANFGRKVQRERRSEWVYMSEARSYD